MPLKDPEAYRAYNQAYGKAHRTEDRAYRKTRYHTDLEVTHAKAKAKRERQGEARKAYYRAYYARTKAKRKALKLKNVHDFKDRHPGYHTRANQAFRTRHPGYYTDVKRRVRAQKLHAPRNDLTRAEWEDIKAHYGSCCVYCGRKMQRLEQDHLTPLSKGGSHTKQNVVPACHSCNSKKNAGPVLRPVQPLLL